MSIFDNSDFRKKLAEEEKHFIELYLEKAKQMLEKNQASLTIDEIDQALAHAKVWRNHLEKTDIKQSTKEDTENKIIGGMELV